MWPAGCCAALPADVAPPSPLTPLPLNQPPSRLAQTLLNDCKDIDPTIRGLAVRSMCSLRVPDLMDPVVSAAWAAGEGRGAEQALGACSASVGCRSSPAPAALPTSSPAPSLQFQAVDGGLRDAHSYVREAAVMGVLKCYHQVRGGG